jgi:ABC-type multidrug transport system permease subunit
VKYVPIEYDKRSGKSHVRLFKDSLRTAQIITQAIIYYNPIKLFLLLMIVSLFGSVVAFVVYSFNYSAIALCIGQGLLIVSFLYFGLGLIAERIDRNEFK